MTTVYLPLCLKETPTDFSFLLLKPLHSEGNLFLYSLGLDIILHDYGLFDSADSKLGVLKHSSHPLKT